MKRLESGVTLEIYAGNIVDCYTDAVVIPTSSTLEWEPELAQELTKRAGGSTLAAARRKAPLELGEAVVTPGGGMLARFIIHVALPPASAIQTVPDDGRRDLLDATIKNSLLRCAELTVPSVGLPNLGGWLGFSTAESARLMLAALGHHWPDECALEEIHLVLRDSAEMAAFVEADNGSRT